MNRFFTDKQGNPLLLTGLQAHNSSTGTDMLDKAIHAVKLYGGNVLETPIYWYAIEPEKDHYDMSLIRETIEPHAQGGALSDPSVVRHEQKRPPKLCSRIHQAGPGDLPPGHQRFRFPAGRADAPLRRHAGARRAGL